MPIWCAGSDENTSPENFLHDLFALDVGNAQWETQKAAFLDAVATRDTVGIGPQRLQDRATESIAFDADAPFANQADTDWSLPQNQAWVRVHIDAWRARVIEPIPLQIGGQLLSEDLAQSGGRDPAQPDINTYLYKLAGREQIELALRAAVDAQAAWGGTSIDARKRLLVVCAASLARRRGDFIGAMLRDAGKAPIEADVEVSEAIDFANYYARAFELLDAGETVRARPLGTVLVTPPWNFPLAIPCGGVLAALMAGNTVILKPAPEVVLTAWLLCNALWDAGIPRSVLQFVPTTDDAVGQALVTDERVNAVILTGAYATGRLFKSWKPGLRLFAETSGKNSMIITALADHDQAIKDLLKSAFGHAGQKCSAASLAVLEAEVYDNTAFLKQLRDAAASMAVGPSWDLVNIIPPVIRAPGAELKRGLTQLDAGESWLLEPRMIDGNPNLWTPGIRLGVKPGSWYHNTECFGPVLGVMRAKDLKHAIEIVNSSPFGLTSGLQTLDNREIAVWREQIQAGNAYINRGYTGAIVQRQPFGGWKRSVFGTAKAGGPNYVASLCAWEDTALPTRLADVTDEIGSASAAIVDWLASHNALSDVQSVQAAAASYARAWRDHFSREHDPSQVLGESNVFRYRPIASVLIRAATQDEVLAAAVAALAARTCGVPATISVAPGAVVDGLALADVALHTQDDATFARSIAGFERVRVFSPLPDAAHIAATEAHAHVADNPLLLEGRLELRHYLREQSITQTTHRYGNLVKR